MNCWEVVRCKPAIRQACPAYPDRGRDCWKITGTMCDGGRMKMATRREKVEHCRSCSFYQEHANKF